MIGAMVALGLSMSPENVCPICEHEFQQGQLVHTECLRQKHGGTLPPDFQKLIDLFQLDPASQPHDDARPDNAAPTGLNEKGNEG